jgi:type IV pilus assembly protein PilM
LKLKALEAEVFGLAKALVKEGERAVLILVDIGAQSTTVSVVDQKILKISHSFDMAGNEFTQALVKSLDIDYSKAEKLKREQGIVSSSENTRKVLLPLIDLILAEINKISRSYYQSTGKEIKKIFLAGGSARLPGLIEYFSENLDVPIEIANPFSEIFSPPILEQTLKEIGPRYIIAVGMALRGLE